MHSVYAIQSAIGMLVAEEDDGAVVRLHLPGCPAPMPAGSPQTELASELAEYFAGQRKSFSVPLAFFGAAFRRASWQAAQKIPYGSTITYAALAEAAGNPKASRAAGQAMATNPLPILIPCHRVVYTHGTKQSYLGGAAMKEFLLELEKNNR